MFQCSNLVVYEYLQIEYVYMYEYGTFTLVWYKRNAKERDIKERKSRETNAFSCLAHM